VGWGKSNEDLTTENLT